MMSTAYIDKLSQKYYTPRHRLLATRHRLRVDSSGSKNSIVMRRNARLELLCVLLAGVAAADVLPCVCGGGRPAIAAVLRLRGAGAHATLDSSCDDGGSSVSPIARGPTDKMRACTLQMRVCH